MPDSTQTDGNLVVPGSDGSPVFIFIHGFGSGPPDLVPLAQAFMESGHACELLHLHGHAGGSDDLTSVAYSSWMDQLRAAHDRHVTLGRRVFLVGFSLGAVLAIDFAINQPVAGILGISAFFEPTHPRLTSLILTAANSLSKQRCRRFLQTTVKRTRKELTAAPHLPVKACRMILDAGRRVLDEVCFLRSPLLLLHSVNDRVASHAAAQAAVHACTGTNARLVTFRNLNHFLQFDVAPQELRALAECFFNLSEPTLGHNDRESGQTFLSLQLDQGYQETRHWSIVLFKLIVGFFAVFGLLLGYSLKDVFERTAKAPYYLVSYSAVINFYLILMALYFFYLVRAEVFLKHWLEPHVAGFPWASYRTTRWSSGKISERMTRLTAIPIAILPLGASAATLIYTWLIYAPVLLNSQNAALLSALLITTSLWLLALVNICQLGRYARFELYQLRRPKSSDPCFDACLRELYDSVSPGRVRQPKAKARIRHSG